MHHGMRMSNMRHSDVPAGTNGDVTEERRGEPIAQAEALTEDEDAGLRLALDSAEAGRGKPAAEVRQRLKEMVARVRVRPGP